MRYNSYPQYEQFGASRSLDQLANTLLAIGQMKRQMRESDAERMYRMQMDRQAQERWQKGFEQDLKEFDWRKELAAEENADRDAERADVMSRFNEEMKYKRDTADVKLTKGETIIAQLNEAIMKNDMRSAAILYNGLMNSKDATDQEKADGTQLMRDSETYLLSTGDVEGSRSLGTIRTGMAGGTKKATKTWAGSPSDNEKRYADSALRRGMLTDVWGKNAAMNMPSWLTVPTTAIAPIGYAKNFLISGMQRGAEAAYDALGGNNPQSMPRPSFNPAPLGYGTLPQQPGFNIRRVGQPPSLLDQLYRR